MIIRTLTAFAIFTLVSTAALAGDLNKVTIAGWGKAISEITNILAEP